MKRIAITIEYNGSNYAGWQKNGDSKSIERELEIAFESIVNQPTHVVASGRTDAGVHAYGQVAHVDLPDGINLKNLHKRINEILPNDIKILAVKEVSTNFHARYNVKSKTYLYKCYTRAIPSPLRNEYYAWVNSVLNLQKIKECALLFLGKHNFKAFCSSGGDSESFDREIISIDVVRRGDELLFYVKGKGFLYNMVRLIVGSLIRVGEGKLSKEQILNALQTGEKANLGEKMPANGLYLYQVEY